MGTQKLPNFESELRGLREAVGEMLMRFRELHNPIKESQEKMPQASRQLSKINDQTEAATTRMLDVAEAITDRDTVMLKQLNSAKEAAEKNGALDLVEKIISCQNLAEQNQNDAFAIMEALQFQDITSQQLVHTMDLLQDIETRMDILLETMDGKTEAKEKLQKRGTRKKAYDPNAKFAIGQSGQANVDSLISSLKSKG
jgi:chemotaxis regulatin CheY-phosphate phosphatase CheZ